MADWYVSSAAYATYTAFQTSHAYVIGNIIVPTAPTAKNKWVFRCTTGGTSTTEPTWSNAASNNSTIASGTATFTNVTGQSAFFWTAASGDLATLVGAGSGSARIATGDRCFLSSDHSESVAGTVTYGGFTIAGFGLIQYICVNRAGSTPPVAADLATGASVTVTSSLMVIENNVESYHYGITYTQTTSGQNLLIGSSGHKSVYLSNCQLFLNNATTTTRITANSEDVTLILDNSTVKFGNASQGIAQGSGQIFELVWQNTASAIAGATIPTILFPLTTGNAPLLVTARGVDLSGTTNTLVQNASATNGGSKFLFDSCKIASGVTRYSTTNAVTTRDLVELVNCFDGTNIISESYQVGGTLTTETTITLNGGAADDVGAFSHLIVTNTNIDKFVNPFCSFWMDVENTTTGSPKTATVEIISSTALNNDEVALFLQYEGTAGSSVASFGNSFIATPLTTPAAVTTSAATWNSSPSTPQKQKCQVSFTPQHAGRLRGQIRVGKASCTVYINPQIAVT